jgi:hypothetical protein
MLDTRILGCLASAAAARGDEVSLSPTGIQLNAKQSLWFLLSFIFPLQIEVDGALSRGTWGPQFLNLTPGMHRIAVTWKMYWVLPVNRGEIEVNVPEGQIIPLRYKMRWLWIMPGKLFIDQSAFTQ